MDMEDRITELSADASAIRTLTLDLSDMAMGENADKLQAILKLAEDQLNICKEISENLTE